MVIPLPHRTGTGFSYSSDPARHNATFNRAFWRVDRLSATDVRDHDAPVRLLLYVTSYPHQSDEFSLAEEYATDQRSGKNQQHAWPDNLSRHVSIPYRG